MEREKNLDAVKLMREIREKHNKEYEKTPELREKRLETIRSEYKNRIKKKVEA